MLFPSKTEKSTPSKKVPTEGRHTPVATGGERKLVSILFADLTGYTALSASLDPEEVYRSLRPGILALQEIVEGFGGSVPQIMGDGFMAVFGVPVAHEDDAERAVRAALAVRDHVVELNAGRAGIRFPEVHAGVNSGEVMVVPSPEAGGFAVIGDTVNTASRLADLANSGTVLVDAITKSRTGWAVRYGPRRTRAAKGKPRLETYAALNLTPGGPPPRAGRLAAASFVDRQRVLDELKEEVARAERAGASRVLVVVGEPGVGKSRLGQEFTRGMPRGSVLVGRCRPFAQRPPLAALAESVAGAASITLDARGPSAEAALARLAARVEPNATAARRLTRGLGLLTGTRGVPAGQARGSLVEASWAARTVLMGLARARPLVVIIDDFHWADTDLRRFVEEAHRSPLDRPVLFLSFSRAEPTGGLPTLDLGSLGEQEMRDLAGALLHGVAPSELLRTAISRAGGNPLFLEETMGMLIESRTLVSDAGRWRVTDAEGLEKLPSAIRLLIAARLDGLPPEEKRVLQFASVAGDPTWDRLIEAISDVGDAGAALRSLARRGLIRRRVQSTLAGATEYEMKHILIRDASYESIPRAERANVHAQIADWLRRRSMSKREEPVAQLAHHYEQAWRLSRSRADPHPPHEPARLAVEYLGRWADRAFAYQARRAERLYARAISIADEAADAVDGRVRAALLTGRAECLIEMGRHREAIDDARRACKAAERATDERLTARALLALGRAESDLGRSLPARRLIGGALVRFEAEGDLRGQGWAHQRLSETWSRTNIHREIEHLRQAHALFARSRDTWGRAMVAQDLAYTLTTRGDKEFMRWFEDARRLAEDEGDLRSRAALLRTWGYVCFYRGDNVGAVGAMREARPITIEAGDRYAEADTLIIEAMAAVVVEGPAEAETLSREVLRMARELRSGRIRTLGLLAAARSAVRAGQPALATRRLAAATKTQREHGIAVDSAEIGRIQAQILIDRGSWRGVEQAARRLGAGVRTSEIMLWQPLESLLRGQALLGAGRLEAAGKELSRAEALAREVEAEPTRELATALREQVALQLGERPGRHMRSAGEPETRALLVENEGIAAIASGDLPRAVEAFASSVALRSPLGRTSFLARALAMQAEATRRLGDRPNAYKLNRRAGSILRTLGTPEPNKARLLRPLDHLPAFAS